ARGDIGQRDQGCAGEMALVPLDLLAHVDHAVPGISQTPCFLDAHLAERGWLSVGHRYVNSLGLIGSSASRRTDPFGSTVKAIGTTPMPYFRARSGRSRTSMTWTRRPASINRLVRVRQSVHSGCVKATTSSS